MAKCGGAYYADLPCISSAPIKVDKDHIAKYLECPGHITLATATMIRHKALIYWKWDSGQSDTQSS